MTKYTPLFSFLLQNPERNPKPGAIHSKVLNMTSYAFYPREPSASTSSGVVDISKLHMFLAHRGTEPFDRPIRAYSLDDL